MNPCASDGAAAGSSERPGARPGLQGSGEPARSTGAEVVLLLFASARVAAGTGRAHFSGATVGEVLDAAEQRYGAAFSRVLERAQIWVDGEPAAPDHHLDGGEEVAVLPPVSGGAQPPCP